MGLVDVNTTAAREHIGEIERGVHLLKELVQYVATKLNHIGIIYLHNQIIIQFVYMVTMFVNVVLATEELLRHYTLQEIVARPKMHFVKDYRV